MAKGKIMKTKICAVCGLEKSENEFENSLRVPKTTCLICLKKNEILNLRGKNQKAKEKP